MRCAGEGRRWPAPVACRVHWLSRGEWPKIPGQDLGLGLGHDGKPQTPCGARQKERAGLSRTSISGCVRRSCPVVLREGAAAVFAHARESARRRARDGRDRLPDAGGRRLHGQRRRARHDRQSGAAARDQADAAGDGGGRRAETHRKRLPPKPLLFQMGLPSLDAFPRKQWAQVATRVVRQFDVEQLAHPHDVMGYAPLRQRDRELSAHRARHRVPRRPGADHGRVPGRARADRRRPCSSRMTKYGSRIRATSSPASCCRSCRCASSASGWTTQGIDVRAGAEAAPDAALAVVTHDASVSARHHAADRSPAGAARLGRPAEILDRRGRLRLRIPSSRPAAAGAQEPRSRRPGDLRRIVQQGAVSRPAAWLSGAPRCAVRALRAGRQGGASGPGADDCSRWSRAS